MRNRPLKIAAFAIALSREDNGPDIWRAKEEGS
jgi:hypothetical protein